MHKQIKEYMFIQENLWCRYNAGFFKVRVLTQFGLRELSICGPFTTHQKGGKDQETENKTAKIRLLFNKEFQ